MLQAETTEDLNEWKTALENALALAPSADMSGQNGFRNDQTESIDISMDQCMLLSQLCFRFVNGFTVYTF